MVILGLPLSDPVECGVYVVNENRNMLALAGTKMGTFAPAEVGSSRLLFVGTLHNNSLCAIGCM